MKPKRHKNMSPARRDPGDRGTENSTPAHEESREATTEQWSKLVKTPEGARVMQSNMLASLVYADQVAGLVGKDNPYHDSAQYYVSDVIHRFNPRDPVEEMLITQMLWTHMRLARLSIGAPKQQNVKWSQHMHEAADRAANTFRRQILALAEYRNPKRGGNSFTAIQQANIAHQQVVQQQNHGGTAESAGQNSENAKHENTRNEQGSAAAQALSADGCGLGIAAGGRGTAPALAAEQRAADGSGEG